MSSETPKYDWSRIPGVDDAHARSVASDAARESVRRADFARWRTVRWAAAVALACLSIAGGAVALLAVLAAATTSGDTVQIVTGIDAAGPTEKTITVAQLYMAVAGIVVMEAVLLWAALLLFTQRLHPAQWAAVLVLAAATSAFFAWAMIARGLDVPGADLPYLIAFPCICAAALLELVRARRLRAAWGEDA
jgi:hypothetical protein